MAMWDVGSARGLCREGVHVRSPRNRTRTSFIETESDALQNDFYFIFNPNGHRVETCKNMASPLQNAQQPALKATQANGLMNGQHLTAD